MLEIEGLTMNRIGYVSNILLFALIMKTTSLESKASVDIFKALHPIKY